jgi:hypothetical protein
MPLGRCTFCADWTEQVKDFNGFMVCESCTDKINAIVAKEFSKMAAPYMAKKLKAVKDAVEQKKTSTEGP